MDADGAALYFARYPQAMPKAAYCDAKGRLSHANRLPFAQ